MTERARLCTEMFDQGLCRTGKMLCCEWDNTRPDVILLGKALSGGGKFAHADAIFTEN